MKRQSIQGALAASGLICALVLSGCGAETPQSLIASGKTYVAKKDHKAAAIQFKAALQLDAQAGEARFLLGKALLDSGDPGGAAVELSKALDQKYDPALVMPSLSRALLLNGEHKKLTTLYGDMVLSDKAALAALKANVASAWGAQGDRAKTEAAIAAALAAAPEFGPAKLLNARLLAGQRQFDDASALVDQVLARDGSLYEAWMLKGEILLYARNDLQAAEASFRKALEIEKAYVPAHLALISMRLRARDLAGAKAQAELLRAVLPKHPQTTFVDAQIAYSDGDVKKARELTQQLLRIAPSHPGVLQLAGLVESRLGSPVLAEAYFLKVLQINPAASMTRNSLARIYMRLGQPLKALETLKPQLAADAGNAEAQAIAGDAELLLGNAAEAEAHFVQAAQISPDNPRLRTAIALAHLSRGDPDTAFSELAELSARSKDTYADQATVSARLKRREFALALAAADVMVKKEPGNPLVFDLRGRVLLASRDYPAARAAFEQALKLDPALFSATSSLVAIDVAEHKPEQARQRLEASIKSDPHNHYALMSLAELRLREGAPLDEVKQLLADAIKAAPSEAAPRLSLINLNLKKRQYKEALSVAQEATAALPNDLTVLDAVGRAQMEAGDVEQAVGTFRKLASINGRSALAYVRLADIFKATGRRELAEVELRRALENEPGLEPAQSALLDMLLARNRPAEALQFARQLQKDRPTEPSGYTLEARFHARKKAPDAAIAALKAGLAKVKDSGYLAREIYKSMLAFGRSADAGAFAAGWLKDHPKDTAFEYQMAISSIQRNELERAETHLQHVLAQRPDDALALNNLAWVLAMQGKPGAVKHAQKAVDLVPASAPLVDTLAMALAADKQLDKALAAQKRAVDLAPDDNGLRLNLAKISLQAGDKTLARKELERLQALGPSFGAQNEVAKLMKSL